jgi:dihydroneopterin aldolase
MGLIEIEGMEFYAYHGHYEEEQIVGNKFLVDIKIEADCDVPAHSDNINDAINYQTVYKIIKKQMKIKSRLLENIVKRIIDAIFDELPGIEKVEVKLSKMNPPMGGKIKKVSVTMSR